MLKVGWMAQMVTMKTVLERYYLEMHVLIFVTTAT